MAPKRPTARPVTVGMHAKDSGSFIRLLMPHRQRMCAPCMPEHNMCCEGVCIPQPPLHNRPSIHLLPISYRKEGDLRYPAIKWLRMRVSEQEWADFIAAIDAANLQGTIKYASCMTVPCSFPLFPCQACCCWIPLQYAEGQRLVGDSAINLAIAKFNRYLFLPRGMLARRQQEVAMFDGERIQFNFIRLDLVPPPQRPLTMGRDGSTVDPRHALLSHLDSYELRPGTMETDIRAVTRTEWLQQSPNIWPCWADSPDWCAMPRLIPEPHFYFDGVEPEIEDRDLAGRYTDRTEQLYAQSQAGPMEGVLPAVERGPRHFV